MSENILHFEENSRLVPSASGQLDTMGAAAAGAAVGAAMGGEKGRDMRCSQSLGRSSVPCHGFCCGSCFIGL